MKSILQSLIAVALATVAHSQPPRLPLSLEDEGMSSYLQKRGNATLQIKIINNTVPVEGTQVKYTTVRMGPENQRTGYTQLNSKGETMITLIDPLPYQQVWLDIENYIYSGLLVNTSLTVRIDAAKLDGKAIYLHNDALTLQGADAGLNNAINKNILFRKKEQDELWGILQDASLGAANKKIPVPQFLKTADSVHQCVQKITAEYLMDNPGYDWAVINENNSQYLGLLALGFANKLMPDSIYKSIMTHQPYFTSNDGTGFYSRLESYLTSKADNPKIDIQKELYARNLVLTNEERTVLDSIDVLESDKESSENKKLLTRLYTKRYKLFKKQIDIVRDHHGIAAIERSCKAPKCDILKLRFLETSKDRFREIYPVLAKTMQPGWAKNYVQKQLNESIAKQKSIDALFTSGKTHASDNYYIGRPLKQLAFDASLYLLDSIANIDEFILNLKNKFANKALILDFWATWCSPCLTDMPYSKKLHQENKDLPIEYVYLCTSSGSDSEIWKNRIGDLKLRGTHIFMEDELMTALRKKINAEGGYPAYAVIDINGNLSAKRISFMSHLDTESLKSIAGIK